MLTWKTPHTTHTGEGLPSFDSLHSEIVRNGGRAVRAHIITPTKGLIEAAIWPERCPDFRPIARRYFATTAEARAWCETFAAGFLG